MPSEKTKEHTIQNGNKAVVSSPCRCPHIPFIRPIEPYSNNGPICPLFFFEKKLEYDFDLNVKMGTTNIYSVFLH